MVAEGVRDKGGHKVTGAQEQVCRVDPKYTRVGELHEGHLDGQGLFHALSQVFDQVVKVCNPEEQGSGEKGDTRSEGLHEQRHHTGTEGKLLGQWGYQVIPDPGQVSEIVFPVAGIWN